MIVSSKVDLVCWTGRVGLVCRDCREALTTGDAGGARRISKRAAIEGATGSGQVRQNQRRVRRSSLNKAVAALFVLLGTAVTAAARQSAMPADIVWKPIEIRNVVDFPKTADLYATLQEKEPY